MVCTYLLKSEKDGGYYTGITDDLDQRLLLHNAGRVKSTSSKRPWKLVYKKEHANYEEARKHEKWLKKKNRQYKDKLVLQVREGGLPRPALQAGRGKQRVVIKKIKGGLVIRDFRNKK